MDCTLMLGPPVLFPVYGWSVALARPGCGDHQTVHDADADEGDRPANHPMWAFGPDLSANPMAYLCVYILIIFFVKYISDDCSYVTNADGVDDDGALHSDPHEFPTQYRFAPILIYVLGTGCVKLFFHQHRQILFIRTKCRRASEPPEQRRT